MIKFLLILFSAMFISCGSVVSSRDAIVKNVEFNTLNKENNPEKYRIYAEYVKGSLYISNLTEMNKSKGFVLLTDVKYNVGDTIRLAR